jgi:glycosyltransferase involved in cell wall biosynthesis
LTSPTSTKPALNIALVIPVWNEAETIADVIESAQNKVGCDIVIIDDASTDASLSQASATGVTTLPLCYNLGAWGAMQTGIRYALSKGYDAVVTMDGDGQHHSEEVSRLTSALTDGDYDVVVGACPERGSYLRQFAWRFFRSLTGVGIEDITSGFRIYNRKSMQVLADREATLLDYQDVGVLLLLQDAGLKVAETRVRMTSREVGKSHIFHSWVSVAYYMLLSTLLSVSKGKPFRISKLNGKY